MFYTEIQDGCQNGGKTIFGKNCQSTLGDTPTIKNFNEITLSGIVSEINAVLHFTQKFKMATKNGGKTIFGKNHKLPPIPCLGVKNSDEIAVSHTFFRDKCVFTFDAEIQDGPQTGRKMIFGKTLALKNFDENALYRID